jgi:DMSO/TMAO reductase YedYZ molybdopterin-dependent catalytic subunit
MTVLATDRDASTPQDHPRAPAFSQSRAAAAGVVSAGLALAVTELVSVIGSRHRPSVVSAVASRFVDLTAGALKDFAVSVFGTNDKAALLTGVVVVSLLLGALLGISGARRRWVVVAGFAAFGILGAICGAADPQGSTTVLVIASLVGALVGIAALAVLLPMASTAPTATGTSVTGTAQDPRVKVADRRTFLTVAGSVGLAAAVTGFVSRGLRGTSVATKSRAATVLPPAGHSVAVPATQPFSADALTPYVTSNADFYRIDTAIFVPQVDASTWKMTIGGMVDHPVTFSYADLLGMDLVEEPVTIACVSNEVGGHLIGNALWRGVPLAKLLGEAGVQSGATQIVGRSVDDFTVGFPTEKALDGRTAMIAVGMNGEPLPVKHGFPARLIVAGLYGYVSATKWLKEITLTRLEDFDAYWVPRGWSKLGPVKTESRVDIPRSGATMPAGKMTIGGVAWAPTRGISRVEVSIDKGPWLEARLGEVASKNTWVQWLYDWNDAKPGSHAVSVRATDGTGEVQTEQPATPAPDGASGYHYRGFTVG